MAQGIHSRKGLAHDKKYLELKRIAGTRHKTTQDYIDMLESEGIQELDKSMRTKTLEKMKKLKQFMQASSQD